MVEQKIADPRAPLQPVLFAGHILDVSASTGAPRALTPARTGSVGLRLLAHR